MILKDLPQEKSIFIITNLPPYLKPFCYRLKESVEDKSACGYFQTYKMKAIEAVLMSMEGYVDPIVLPAIRDCLPKKVCKESVESKLIAA
ncbi:hypothetical protein [Sporocytophaga myxococcoides]|uniref:hypothetical protein n=1 Tax=Sporocytophaga myxococcoides TaxID=153721 RepID=UPI0012DD1596|nr:hypothetical protein [Sporocytophaga myxococcoides]